MPRTDGYAPIADYALIGDGRTTALVARDGSVDWWCLPDVDSHAVFWRLLDAERGGSFELCPTGSYGVERSYEPGSNVLETVFRTAAGAVRVTDAMTLGGDSWATPLRELVRSVHGLEGEVELEWSCRPRFGFGMRRTELSSRSGRPFAQSGGDGIVLGLWDAGEPTARDGAIEGTFRVRAGETALLQAAAVHQGPAVLAGRDEVERRLAETRAFWPRWSEQARYDGPWRDEVVRSALALKLLVYAPSGAIVAAPTTSLPEWIGGSRNWDYRFTWLRDATWTLAALLRLGYSDEAQAFFWWLMHASRLTQPRLNVLYRVDGGERAEERELSAVAGYRRSRPVRVGNGAAGQVQLDIYGAVLDAAWRFVAGGHDLDRSTGKQLGKIVDYVTRVWRGTDSGIWEVRGPETHFTQSKALCWLALDRGVRLAERGHVPSAHVEHWRSEAQAVRAFVEDRCWSAERRSFVRSSDSQELDASLLTLALLGYDDAAGPRLTGTIEAVRRELAAGPLVYRYRTDDGLAGDEGAFVTCSFWLADALARNGRLREAQTLMQDLVERANDVGLFAEEIDRDGGEMLGNFPQGLTHLALVNAALSLADAEAGTAS